MIPLIVDWIAPAIFGACVGSFLNVVIYRLPLDKSVIYPGSHCAACGTPIRWQHNIPVLSWFWLKGYAPCCGTKIDFRYAVVEAFTACLFVLIWNMHGYPLAIPYLILACGLVAGSCIDLDLMIIPDRITLGGAACGLVLSVIYPALHQAQFPLDGFLLSLGGALFSGAILLAVSMIGTLVLRKEAMGMGDVKLMLAFGAFFGWLSTFYIIAVASILGSIFGLGMLLFHKMRWGLRMPFGPFLSLAALCWMLGGNIATANYFHDMFVMLGIDPSWLY